MLLVLVAGFIAEVVVLVLVGSQVGVLATLGLLVLAVMLGFALVSGRGAATVRAVVVAVRRGESPGAAIVDSAIFAIAGILLILPGFLSDVAGLLLLLPPVRAGIRARLKAWLVVCVGRHPMAGQFVGHDEDHVADGVDVIDVSGTERRDPPRGSRLPS